MNRFARRHSVTVAVAAAILSVAALTAMPSRAFEISWGGEKVTGSGKPASDSRAVTDFQGITVRGPIDVVVRQTGHEAVEVRGDDNVVPLVETTVESGGNGRTLVIGMKKGLSLHTRSHMVVTVDVITLRSISSSGSGDVRIESLKTPSLKLSLQGASDAKLGSLQADELTIGISGSGDVDASAGRAGRLNISIAGSGDARLANLQADDVNVSIAGSGDADVNAGKTLSVSIAGSGDVVYRGSGNLTKSSIAGSGSITHR